jgi:PhnB protein
MHTEPYLFFDGRCAEAFEFYRDALGAEIRSLVRSRDMPGAPADVGDKVIHAVLGVGDSTILGSDMLAKAGTARSGFSISLQVAEESEAERLFEVLSNCGQVEVPMMSTPFASRYAKVVDRFGTPWIIV